MDIAEKIKTAVAGAKPDHPHGFFSDAWQQVVHRVGPKIAKAMWETFPDSIKEKLADGWVKELFQGISLVIAQILPNKGIAQMIDALQVEVAAELHELASAYGRGGKSEPGDSASTYANAGASTPHSGTEGAHQILRLELELAQRIVSWVACAAMAGMEPADIVKFLDGLTLRELRTFAKMDDGSKQAYIEAVLKKPLPKVQSESTWKKISEWFDRKWEEAKECGLKVNSDLEEIALLQDAETRRLEDKVARLRAQAEAPLGAKAWQIWKL